MVRTERPADARIYRQSREVISLFGDAAARAKAAGFDGVQIHAAHGFFLSRFISLIYNHRTDAYGGSVSGRAQILLDVLADIRKKAPGIHVTMKINCSDFMRGCSPFAKDVIENQQKTWHTRKSRCRKKAAVHRKILNIRWRLLFCSVHV